MLQAYNAIKMYPPAEHRLLDIADLKGHLIRVFDHSRKFITGLPHGQSAPDNPDAIFMFSGYSWKTHKFHIWRLHYDASIDGFSFRPTTEWSGGQEETAHKLIAFVGDRNAIADAKARLIGLLRERNKLTTASLNMEPFEVLRDVIRGGLYPSVGGPIQLVKIYEHSNAVPVGVYWPNKSTGSISVLGRPLMNYETIPWGVIDPDNPGRAWPMDRRPTETLNTDEV
jgi:hypothetical protein